MGEEDQGEQGGAGKKARRNGRGKDNLPPGVKREFNYNGDKKVFRLMSTGLFTRSEFTVNADGKQIYIKDRARSIYTNNKGERFVELRSIHIPLALYKGLAELSTYRQANNIPKSSFNQVLLELLRLSLASRGFNVDPNKIEAEFAAPLELTEVKLNKDNVFRPPSKLAEDLMEHSLEKMRQLREKKKSG